MSTMGIISVALYPHELQIFLGYLLQEIRKMAKVERGRGETRSLRNFLHNRSPYVFGVRSESVIGNPRQGAYQETTPPLSFSRNISSEAAGIGDKHEMSSDPSARVLRHVEQKHGELEDKLQTLAVTKGFGVSVFRRESLIETGYTNISLLHQ